MNAAAVATSLHLSPDPPLRGVSVVESGTHRTAPCCARLLRRLGAMVVKVEPPGGDPLRHVGAGTALGALFGYLNEGKDSVAVDSCTWQRSVRRLTRSTPMRSRPTRRTSHN